MNWHWNGTNKRESECLRTRSHRNSNSLSLFAPSARHWNNLGGILYGVAQYKLALDVLNQTIALNPNLATAHVNLADTHYALRDFQNAKKHYQKALILGLTNSITDHVQKQIERIP